ncbi:MAG TPA: YegS/Rv2252/BmrU family lipid kinase [Tepidisphaeraceae bacterium]|jgi:YegS/Rv2252/BmrU family lipid kinase|nr:YegS/Rv2252/BmrU family lipid kinase [Tepidisphaeraceae bacterium]
MDEVLIFANPTAGKGKSRIFAERIAERLNRSGMGVRVFFESAEGMGSETLETLADAKAMVVIGGDGTLRGVVGRAMRECGGTSVPPVVVVPMGTANLMAQHLGLKWNEEAIGEEVAEVIRAGKVVELNAAAANGKLFLLMAGVGIDAGIVHQLEKMRRGPISMASYALPAALALAGYRYPAIQAEVDGKVVFRERAGIAMVGNVKEYGTGFEILPLARADDGLLDICVMPCGSPQELAELFLRAAVGEHLQMEGVVYVKGRRVRITAAESVPVQVDGDAAGFTPLEVEMLERRVRFLVSAK